MVPPVIVRVEVPFPMLPLVGEAKTPMFPDIDAFSPILIWLPGRVCRLELTAFPKVWFVEDMLQYLSNFEAHWAVVKRLRYAEVYNKALQFISSTS